MASPVIDLSSTIECPNCGKHSVVSHQAGSYHCLNCNFERTLHATDRSEPEGSGGFGEFLCAIAGFLVVAAIML